VAPSFFCRDPHYILDKLVGFSMDHQATHAQLREHLATAAAQLPNDARPREAKALDQSAARFRRARTPHLQSLGEILKEVLAEKLRLTVQSSTEV
jgi:hypothetical protein